MTGSSTIKSSVFEISLYFDTIEHNDKENPSYLSRLIEKHNALFYQNPYNEQLGNLGILMDIIRKTSSTTEAALLKPHVFRGLLLFAMSAFAAIWSIDYTSGIIALFDAASYPICIAGFATIYLLSRTKKASEQSLHLTTYLIVAGYLTSSSIWHHMAENGLFSNSAQWLGLNYVIAYLFLEVRKAVIVTIASFIVTLIGHYLALIQHYPLDDTVGVVLNIGIAHTVYIVLLWTVVQMRVEHTKTHERLSTLEQHAMIDQLTNVLNRRGIEDVFKHAEENWINHKQPYAILLIDIDHFKQVNDQYGHLVGDKVLADFAALLNKLTVASNSVGRWGGEEFIILVKSRSNEECFSLAEKVRQTVERSTLGGLKELSISIGVGYANEEKSLFETFQQADSYLYAAKKTGRNKVIDRNQIIKKRQESATEV
ncbi:diguanylate cyclase [Marinomonas mediterranea MMB-1]|uniref:diguanylate cyclase n=2 Tax=Marinomonas mediterranea TaxID=119864 RepID=F2JVM2_MARM1|nr:diguanylate cyclase [Marinomonas mediterranea MMB-1]